jgi:uncharacterized SAM-binding protein YcdF (DUF218 family)
MYFILSKILLFLLVPLNWVLALLIIAIFKDDKVKRRRYLIAGLTLLYVFTTPFLFKEFTRLWDIKPIAKADTTKYSCVIVLGGFSGPHGHSGGNFNMAADRFIYGAMLLTTGKANRILITGGNGSLVPGAYREATWAKVQLQKLGISDSLILTEPNSRNTLENAEFSKKVLQAHNLKPPYLLVTSASHMRRAVMIFNKKGMAVTPYPTSYLTDNSHIVLTDLLPQADVLSRWEFYLKEVVGYVVNSYGAK